MAKGFEILPKRRKAAKSGRTARISKRSAHFNRRTTETLSGGGCSQRDQVGRFFAVWAHLETRFLPNLCIFSGLCTLRLVEIRRLNKVTRFVQDVRPLLGEPRKTWATFYLKNLVTLATTRIPRRHPSRSAHVSVIPSVCVAFPSVRASVYLCFHSICHRTCEYY